MNELKPISREAIPQAIEKAHHYRLLNEPSAAESICRDILDIEPDNQQALSMLLLALTDRLTAGYSMGRTQAREVLHRIEDDYLRTYYSGLICERQAKALLKKGGPGSRFDAYEWLIDAMEWYEKAETIKPINNDDSILRWNACVRIINNNQLAPRTLEKVEPYLE